MDQKVCEELRKLAERLRAKTIDWDRTPMSDGAEPIGVECIDLRAGADAIDTLLACISKQPTKRV